MDEENRRRVGTIRQIPRGSVSKLSKAVSNPNVIIPYLEANIEILRVLRSRGRVDEAVAYVPTIFGADTYTPYLSWKADGRFLEREILGNRMLLDPHDKGISQDLLLWGAREELPVAAYQEALKGLAETVDGSVTVLDIGANIGYYLLAARKILGENAALYAVEPHPDNFQLLNRNLALNDYQATTVQGAIDRESGEATLHISDNSNKHRIDEQPEGGTEVDTMEVKKWSVDDFIGLHGISPSRVNVLRMDVEGHELNVLEGASEVLASKSPLVMYVEIHLGILDEDQLNRVIQILRDACLEITAAFYDPPLIEGERLEISDLSELPEQPDEGIQLILQRNISEDDRTP